MEQHVGQGADLEAQTDVPVVERVAPAVQMGDPVVQREALVPLGAHPGVQGATPAGMVPPAVLPPEPLVQIVQGLLQVQQQQSAQILEGFQALVVNLQALQAVQQVRVGGVKEFKGLHPPEFSGSGSPIDADEWFEHVQRLLIAAVVPEIERVHVVQILLIGVARTWFDVESVAGEMTWEDFRERFYDQFFP